MGAESNREEVRRIEDDASQAFSILMEATRRGHFEIATLARRKLRGFGWSVAPCAPGKKGGAR